MAKSFGSFSTHNGSATACIPDGSSADLSQDFDWPSWTKQNCYFYTGTLFWSTCSLSQTFGIHHKNYEEEDTVLGNPYWNLTYARRECQTNDMIEFYNSTLISSIGWYYEQVGRLQDGKFTD